MRGTRPALVIGGTRGTGLLIAERLVRRGTGVRVLARNPARAAARLPREVEIVHGDLTKPDTLPPAVTGVEAIILTAGCRSGRPARESVVRATEFDGVRHVISSARESGFAGRFLYMTSSGVKRPSIAATLLNLYKGNTLRWRLRVEDEIRASGLDFTIIRVGFLLNRPGGTHALHVTQKALPLSPGWRIARADVADVFVAALDSPHASRTTFEVVWGDGRAVQPASELLLNLRPDESRSVLPGRRLTDRSG